MALPAEVLALVAAATWACSSLLSATAVARMGPFSFSRWRMVFACLLLWGMALVTGSWRSLQLDGVGVLALSGFVGIFIGDTALFACMNRLGPRRSGILFATHALFSVVLAWLFLGETLSPAALVGSALLIAGVMTAIAFGRRDIESHQWEATKGRLVVGIGLGLLSALGQSVATLMLKPLMETGLDPVAASAVRMSSSLAAHLLLLLTGWRLVQATRSPRWGDLGYTFASAAIGMALGMTLILKALQHGSVGMVEMLSSVTPVLLLPVLWWVYRRRPALGGWVGAVLTVAGCALILLRH
jgi:drug/metabolite transporter (DMT)-like permease